MQEELTMDGRLSITLNADGELCAVKKSGGVAIGVDQLLECTRIAGVKATEVTKYIRARLENPDDVRASHKPTAFSALPKEITVTYGDEDGDVEMGEESDSGGHEDSSMEPPAAAGGDQSQSGDAVGEDVDMEEHSDEIKTVQRGGEAPFEGGRSQWDQSSPAPEEPAASKPTKRNWEEDNDSEEEETVVMLDAEVDATPAPAEEEAAPKKAKKVKKKKAGDLSAAVKKKKTKKKKAGDLSAAVKAKKGKK